MRTHVASRWQRRATQGGSGLGGICGRCPAAQKVKEGRFAARPLRVGKAAAVGSSEDDPSQERPQEVPSEAGEEGGERIPFRADKGVTVVRRWRCISLHKGQSRF